MDGWGQYGSSTEHERYIDDYKFKSRKRRCSCGCQRQFKIDPLIDVIAEVKLIHPRN